MKLSPNLFRSLLVASAVSITACGGSDNNDDSNPNIDAHNSAGLTSIENSISGNGSAIFTSSLGAIDSGAHFAVVAALDIGESFTIHAYSDNQLANGIDLMVTRPANTPTNLEVMIEGHDISSNFSSVEADHPISIFMDVHNDESPAHVLIWTAEEEHHHHEEEHEHHDEEREHHEGHLEEDDAVFNSENVAVVNGQGAGAFWGLTLVGAEVTTAKAEEAAVGHDH